MVLPMAMGREDWSSTMPPFAVEGRMGPLGGAWLALMVVVLAVDARTGAAVRAPGTCCAGGVAWGKCVLQRCVVPLPPMCYREFSPAVVPCI